MQTDCDVLIAGNGLAALTLALSLPESFRIVILCKNRLDDTASRHAQGGIAAAWSGEDDIEKHVADTLEAGAGLCNEAAVRTILSQGKPAIEWLLAQGVAFDRNHNDLHLTREGGHTCRRIAHVADYTGEAVMQSLIAQIRRRPNIRVCERQMALDVQTESGSACGLTILDRRTQETYSIRASHTVLAGGGLGQIYAATTTPPECTGDAIAMAIRAGCAVENLEFIQFHPTGLARSSENGRTFLISEAVRGEGGILTNQAGERFMPHYDRRAELAPRDIVARAIAAEIAKQTQDFVSLDISRKPAEFVRQHFPSIHRHCLSQCGLDITRQAIPVRPVQHYTCGGIQTDPCGRTSLPQLYALGETACTGLHGANRLASNSLLECVVTARLAAQTIADRQAFQTVPSKRSSENPTAEAGIFSDDLQNTFSRPVLQTFNQRHLGILRNDTGLRRAIAQLRLWKQNQAEPHTASEYENRNLLECSLAVAQAAYARRQNIGAHFNTDLAERVDWKKQAAG